MVRLITFIVGGFHLQHLSCQNLPAYQSNYDKLLAISKRQHAESLIGATYSLPKLVNANPAILRLPQQYITDGTDRISEQIYLLWCPRKAWKPPCMWTNFPLSVLQPQSSSISAMRQFITEKRQVQYDSMRYAHMVEDARLFMDSDANLHIIYSVKTQGKYGVYVARLHMNYSSNSFYLQFPISRLLASHDQYSDNEKNWSPFLYERRLDILVNNKLPKTLFVYSIVPHRIVMINESTAQGMHAVTVFVTATRTTWMYGAPRGGTPCELVRTRHGLKYLSFFHSHGRYNHPAILTWYMGAYLFEAEPPFAVEYMSREPLYPKALYDETEGGWAYKAVDYIVYPLGFVVNNGTVYLSVGKNDNSGWIIALDMTILVDNMISVSGQNDKRAGGAEAPKLEIKWRN